MLKATFLAGLLLSGSGFAQSNTFTIANIGISGSTAGSSDYSTPFVGSGSGDSSGASGAGSVAIALTGAAARERGLNCGKTMQMAFVLAFNSADSISLILSANFTSTGSTLDVQSGSFNVTGGTGAYTGHGGSGFGFLTFTIAADGTFQVKGSLGGTLTSTVVKAATVLPSGIVPVYSSVPIIQPGAWISIYGSNLGNAPAVWNGDFPVSLQGVSVKINDRPGYIWAVSPTQINLQAPDMTNTGCVSVVITTPNGSITTAVTLQPQQPSLSLLSGKYIVAEIATPDGSGAYGRGATAYDLVGPAGAFSFSTRPVKVGETLVLYGVGFGTTNPSVPAGLSYSGASPTLYLPVVTIGGVQARVVFSGIVAAGLYQINIVVPPVVSGDQLIAISIPAPNSILFSANQTQTNIYVTVQ